MFSSHKKLREGKGREGKVREGKGKVQPLYLSSSIPGKHDLFLSLFFHPSGKANVNPYSQS